MTIRATSLVQWSVGVLALLGIATPTRAQSATWAIGPFTKPAGVNPIVSPSATASIRSPITDSLVQWEQFATFNPAAVVRGGKVYVLYRAEDATGDTVIGGHTSRIGMAESTDGLHFTRLPTPVLFPERDGQQRNEWPGGVEDPRIVDRDDGEYVLTYTQWNRQVPRLAVATSRDLVHWTKHGPAFSPKYQASETKSGAILCKFVGERCVAARVNGRYWMYYNVPRILVATSDDLVSWTPLEDDNGHPLEVLSPRPGYFDSWLVEAGAPAVLTDRGIVLLYNAGNSRHYGDPGVPARTYTAGQALFDARNPVRLIARTEAPFLRPSESYEKSGQYKEGTTFVEGLVRFKGRWLLYYGTADSRVAVATSR